MPPPESLKLHEGRWHLIASTFPMWLKGDRQQPCFNYRVIADGRHWALDDCVTYRKQGRERRIPGISRPQDNQATRFVWRGRGWLRLIRSEWEIFHLHPDDDVAVVVFGRTLFTPAGADVIARTPQLSDEQLHAAAAAMRQHPVATAHVDALLRLPN